MRQIWLGIGSALLFLILLTPLSAQMVPGDSELGPIGNVNDTDTPPPSTDPEKGPIPDVEENFDSYPGPIGRVDDRLPHGACDTCFTVPGLGEGQYQIFERMEVEGKEILIPRKIANPAPAVVNEELSDDEEADEDVWYIGTQGYIGPQDTEKWADTAPLSTIALKRIQMKHAPSILRITGVHRFGINDTGFVVGLTPEHALSADQIPLSLDNVPVLVELEDPGEMAAHHTTKLRPVPVGAGIGVPVSQQYPGSNYWTFHSGTVGPHVVRNASDVGDCCQLWSLTAGHVVKSTPDASNPIPGTRKVYQPWGGPYNADTHIGYVAHVFRLRSCSTVTDPYCNRQSSSQPPVPINSTLTRPDIAAIDYLPFGDFQASPFNDPTGKNPVRHLQSSATGWVDGPAGKIFEPRKGHRHKMWGSRTPAGRVGKVQSINDIVTLRLGDLHKRFRICCLNRLTLPGIRGDSGALVAYQSSRDYKRYVAGVAIALDDDQQSIWYVPASDIKTAFDNASKSFHHYWGTRQGYREPSTQSTDD